jgi:hypothetical protein
VAHVATVATPVAAAVAQIATPGDGALPVTRPVEITPAFVVSELLHDTAYPTLFGLLKIESAI